MFPEMKKKVPGFQIKKQHEVPESWKILILRIKRNTFKQKEQFAYNNEVN